MLRDNLAGLIEPMFDSAGAVLKLRSRAVVTNKKRVHRTIDPVCLENPRPEGAESFPEFPDFLSPSPVASLSGSDDADQFLELTSRRLLMATHGSI